MNFGFKKHLCNCLTQEAAKHPTDIHSLLASHWDRGEKEKKKKKVKTYQVMHNRIAYHPQTNALPPSGQ